MIDQEHIKRIYFVGIGGIGMSALARYFNDRHVSVSGYDRTATSLTAQLAEEGIAVHYTEDTGLIDKDADLVVYTPAIPKDHAELQFYRQHHYTVLKRSEVLEAITKDSYNICIAGTHGKTTTSTLVAHILRNSGFGCNAFLGGIAVNYDTNFWSSQNNVCVVEADEYDRSFLKLKPDVALISSMDADHLDIYGTAKNMEQAFIDFTGKLKPGGLLIYKYGLHRKDEFKAGDHLTYHLQHVQADVHAANIRINQGSYLFDVIIKGRELKDVVLNMGGMHNIENSVAAITIAKHVGIGDEAILKAVDAFRGVRRRFDYVIKNEHLVFIDDYAHHPQELSTLLSSVRKLFPGKKCTVIFQPHLYSRTRDFAAGFASSLDLADEIILLPVYPARELPMEGVNSELIASKMSPSKVTCCSKEDTLVLLKNMSSNMPDQHVLVTAGAGDIDKMVNTIKLILEKDGGK